MKRLGLVLCLLLAACDKPTPENCRKALLNMQHLLGTENLVAAGSLEGEVRRCRGGSSKAAVDCAIKANTLDELEKCAFTRVPIHAKGGSDTGSGAAPSGSGSSAAPGSAAPAGSAGSGR